MNDKTRLRAAGLALAVGVPFGIALLAQSASIAAADPLACIVGECDEGSQALAIVDRSSGGVDDASILPPTGNEPAADVTSLF